MMNPVAKINRPTYEEMTHKKEGDIYASFMALVLKPYKDRKGAYQPSKVLMNHRWDGLIGLPGGKVDYHLNSDGKLLPETLEQACAREVREEIGMRVHPQDLKYVCTHEFARPSSPDSKVIVSLFCRHVTIDEIQSVPFWLDVSEVSGVEYMTFKTIEERDEITCDSVAEEMVELQEFLKNVR